MLSERIFVVGHYNTKAVKRRDNQTSEIGSNFHMGLWHIADIVVKFTNGIQINP